MKFELQVTKKVHVIKGYDAIRNSPEMLAVIDGVTEAIAAAAGPGNVAKPAQPGRKRARGAVVAESFEAMAAEARDHNLIRALSQVQE